MELAKILLENKEPIEALSSLLEYFYKDELDRSQYRNIEVLNAPKDKKKKDRKDREDKKASDKKRPLDKIGEPSLDEEGFTRLFIARGRNDGITKRDLVNIIIAQAGVDNNDIHDVQVMEEFSFINAPYAIAERILKVFDKRNYGGSKPLVTRAKAESSDKRKSSKSRKDKDSRKSKSRTRIGEEEFEDSKYRAKGDSSKRSSRGGKGHSSKSRGRRSRH